MKKIDLIRQLEKEGVLREGCPEPHYWHFSVLQPEKLPDSLAEEYRRLGEIRW